MCERAGTDVKGATSRRFGLVDAMIFIVAFGLAFAVARPAIFWLVDSIRSDARWGFLTRDRAARQAFLLNNILLQFVFFLLPAVLIVRLRRPRPPLRSLVCQPGFVACAGPVVVFLATLPLALLSLFSMRTPHAVEIAAQALIVVAAPGAWVFLFAMGRWTPDPGWIDRLGRFLGILAMVATPLHLVLLRLVFS